MSSEATVYRPSVVVNIKLRFDEAITGETMPDVESVETLLSKAVTDDSGKPNPLPGLLQPGDPQFSFIAARIPRTLTWEKPGYRQAGHFKATFAFSDLPVIPELVRAAAVEIYTGTVSDDDFARGIAGTMNGGGQPTSVLQPVGKDFDPAGGRRAPLVCIVDEWTTDADDNGTIVTLEGRDMRGVLIDTPINAGIPDAELGTTPTLLDELDLTRPVDEVVTQILRFNEFFGEFTVVTNPEDWPDSVIPSPGPQDSRPRHRKGARGKNKKGVATQDSGASEGGLSFWDLIVKVCYLVGGIPYFRGTQLIIRPAMTVYDKLRGPIDPVRNPTPFKDGKQRQWDPLSDNFVEPMAIRRLYYGRDIKSLKMGRKYQGWRKPKVIRAVGFDSDAPPGSPHTIIGVWPPEDALPKTKVTSASPGKSVAGQEILSIPVPGVRSVTQLTHIAHAIYEEIGRGELTGECETEKLASFGGDNSDPDLLSLEPGDGIQLLVDTRGVHDGAPGVASFIDHYRKPMANLIQDLTTILGDRNLARAIVITSRSQSGAIQHFFRVQNVKFNWNCEGDITIGFDFQNYVVARAQADNASSTPGAIQTATTPTSPSKKPGGGLGSALKGRK